ncbi:hypothetical protein GN244_ATG19803 [Phytophthora infestans]|uniref:Uncharacterized protein n=1 Tax=Phytophthora infestans TaxID=4787 RepID=A0A833VTZ4_PHYIN|nr:hypothetical protein GN244_ATG19803 [Phytophthora infestans]KAF4149788.1 hypothetical protein GN958_ATG01013 [Phytophthora infestans]
MSGSNGFRSRYDWIACADHKIATVLTTVLCKTTEVINGVRSKPFYKFRERVPEVFNLIDACKELVRYIKQADLQAELSKTLKQENVTRWGSNYRKLSSVFEMYDELAAAKVRDESFLLERHRLTELLKPHTDIEIIPSDSGPVEVMQPDSVSLVNIKQVILTEALPKWRTIDKHIVAAILDNGKSIDLINRATNFGKNPGGQQRKNENQKEAYLLR